MEVVKFVNTTIPQENSTHRRRWYCLISLPVRVVPRGGDSSDEVLLLRQSMHMYRDREHLVLQRYRSDGEWVLKSRDEVLSIH